MRISVIIIFLLAFFFFLVDFNFVMKVIFVYWKWKLIAQIWAQGWLFLERTQCLNDRKCGVWAVNQMNNGFYLTFWYFSKKRCPKWTDCWRSRVFSNKKTYFLTVIESLTFLKSRTLARLSDLVRIRTIYELTEPIFVQRIRIERTMSNVTIILSGLL